MFAHNASWLFVIGNADGKDNNRKECGADWQARNDTLHATYSLLQSLGVSWLGPYAGGDIVPSRATVAAPAGGKPLRQSPALLKRQIRHVYRDPATFEHVPWLNESVFEALRDNGGVAPAEPRRRRGVDVLAARQVTQIDPASARKRRASPPCPPSATTPRGR